MRNCKKCGAAPEPGATVCPACGETLPLDLKHRLMAQAAQDAAYGTPTAPEAAANEPVPQVHTPGLTLAEAVTQAEAKKQLERKSIQQHLKTMAARPRPADQPEPSSAPVVDPFPLHLKPALIALLLWLLLAALMRPGRSGGPASLERAVIACLPLYAGLFALFWDSLGEFVYDFGWFLWGLLERSEAYYQTGSYRREGTLLGFLKATAWLAGSVGGTVLVYRHYYPNLPILHH